ncbi:MAG: T9SS type A sorting domain-containing protein [Prolixibacteraceae bacterium]|jgi:hypothetical protein|nr:T9SS type A sorting domain-containing protein [Prolixibacteraceae bacterium]
MRKIILLISLSLLTQFLSAQIEMPPNNSIYSTITCYGPPGLDGAGCYGNQPDTIRYSDTLINSIKYQKYSETYLARYEKKRYIVIDSAFENNEYVLYDFNLEVDDTLHLMPLDEDLIVTYKDVIIIENGESRIHMKLDGKTGNTEWIEGLGDIWNGFNYYHQFGLYDIHTSIVCIRDNEDYLYKSPTFNGSCEDIANYANPWTNIDLITNDFSVWPNPFKNQINFSNNQENEYIIYNFKGEILKKGNCESINTSDLKQGIYFIEVTIDSKKKLFQIIKQ